jgi:hypothetical protein
MACGYTIKHRRIVRDFEFFKIQPRREAAGSLGLGLAFCTFVVACAHRQPWGGDIARR